MLVDSSVTEVSPVSGAVPVNCAAPPPQPVSSVAANATRDEASRQKWKCKEERDGAQCIKSILLWDAIEDFGGVHAQGAVVVEDQTIEACHASHGDGIRVEHLRVAIGVDHHLARVG